jgi:exopolysaccharide biosynthesis polyprenyl glycosylphosphotransferase
VIHIFNRSVPVRSFALRVAEALLVFVALFVAAKSGVGNELTWAAANYVQVGLVGSVLLLSMYCFDTYEPQVTTHHARSLSRIIQAIGLTMLTVAAVPLAWPWVRIDVPSLLVGIVLLGAALALSRYLFAQFVTSPEFAEPAVIWGSGPLAATIIRELRSRPDVGIRVVGVVEHTKVAKTLEGVPYLGSPEKIWPMAESGETRRIIVAIGDRRGRLPIDRLMALKAAGFVIEDGKELYEELTGKVWLEGFSVGSLLFSRRFQSSWFSFFVNRAISMFFALIVLVIAAPVLVLTALAIRLDSKGPIILRQIRIGVNGQPFTLLKFRSMFVGAERAETTAPATKDDPRCTRVGKWIRRLRLDELPQLFNILRGDMYFIGPRPFVPDQEASLMQLIPNYRQRWAVRPGATGWAQVNRDYCASIEDNIEKLSYDLFYIKNRSLGLDIVTMLKTFKILLLGRGGR